MKPLIPLVLLVTLNLTILLLQLVTVDNVRSKRDLSVSLVKLVPLTAPVSTVKDVGTILKL